MLGLLAGGFIAFRMLSKPAGPPPPEVAKDPLLSQGRSHLSGALRRVPRHRWSGRRPDRRAIDRSAGGQSDGRCVEARRSVRSRFLPSSAKECRTRGWMAGAGCSIRRRSRPSRRTSIFWPSIRCPRRFGDRETSESSVCPGTSCPMAELASVTPVLGLYACSDREARDGRRRRPRFRPWPCRQ